MNKRRKIGVTKTSSDKLADLVTKRHACLLQLRELGRKQSALITAGDMGTLLRLISAKNQLIVALQAIEKELTPFHAQDPEERDWPSPEARTACADQAAQCRVLLEKVMQLERQNERLMTSRRDQVASQLQAAQAASAARGAYQAQQLALPQGSHSAGSGFTAVGCESRLDIHSEA